MSSRFSILTVLDVFTPRTRWHLFGSVLFWEGLFCSVHLLLLWGTGMLGSFPLWQHAALGAVLCAPFLTLAMLLVMQHLHLSAKFKDQAEMDPLTGLPNRRFFFKEAQRERDQKTKDLIMLLDIDHFKRVNDRFGHQQGDTCLKEVSKFLEGWMRPDDLICRYGGEEFAMLLRDISIKTAMPVAQTVSYGHRFDLDRERISITFSMGLATWEDGQTLDEVLHNADQALYAAKSNGRAQAQVYDPDPADLHGAA